MSETRTPNNDEIDLFEFLETLWNGKSMICGCIVLALVIGYGYIQLATVKYKVTVSYVPNLYSVSSQQTCGGTGSCLSSQISNQVLRNIDSTWIKQSKSDSLNLTSSNPLSIEKYVEIFQGVGKNITKDVLNEAKAELSLIQTELNDALLGTERVATNMLNAHRVITAIESGETVIEFSKPTIIKTNPKSTLVLALSIILGGMAGAFYTLFRNALYKRAQK